jgi:hypothetical protein
VKRNEKKKTNVTTMAIHQWHQHMRKAATDTHKNKDYDNDNDNYERGISSSSPSKYSQSIKNGPPTTSSSFNLEFIEEVSSVAELSRQGTSMSPRKKKKKKKY